MDDAGEAADYDVPDSLAVQPLQQRLDALLRRREQAVLELGVERRRLLPLADLDVAALTEREKQRPAAAPTALAGRVRASRGARVSFAERLRSRQHEHRAAQA